MDYDYNSTKTRPKNRGKNCLFQCFRHDNIVIDNSFETTSSPTTRTVDPLLTYIAVAGKEGMVFPTILSTAWTATKGGGVHGIGWPLRKKGSGDRSLRNAFMAALNETSLGKKIKRRKKNKDSLCRSSSISHIESVSDKISNKESKMTLQTYSINSSSNFSPAFTSSSFSSSKCPTTFSGRQTSGFSLLEECSVLKSLPVNEITVCLTEQKQEVGDNRRGYYGSNNMTISLLLTSLLILVLYGKFCAILYTTIGFFVVSPHRRRPYKNEGSLYGEHGFDSVQYEKKICMEDMLEGRSRNNNHT